MALETGTYVNDLKTANPTSTDPKSQGDDHLRLIKSVLKNTFAGFQGLVVVTGTESQGATASDYVVTVAPAPAAYTAGFFVAFKATHANTGVATLTVNTLAAKALKAVDGSALEAGTIQSGALCVAFYDGADFYLISANGALRAPTPPAGDNSTRLATTAFVVQQAFQAALPAQINDGAPRWLRSQGGSASWEFNSLDLPLMAMGIV